MSGKSTTTSSYKGGFGPNRTHRTAPYYHRASYADVLRRSAKTPKSRDPITEDLRSLHDLHPRQLKELSESLDAYNTAGTMVTFDKVTEKWAPWYRWVVIISSNRSNPYDLIFIVRNASTEMEERHLLVSRSWNRILMFKARCARTAPTSIMVSARWAS